MKNCPVDLYISNDSPPSQQVKEMLTEHGVKFNEIVVDGNDEAKEKLVKQTGQWSVPGLVIWDQTGKTVEGIVVGYEPHAIKELLELED